MITIKSLSHAKKLTQTLFTASQDAKFTLNKLRAILSKETGYSQLKDAFHNPENIQYLKDNYITVFDDPRITIEVARIIQDNHEVAEEYFNERLVQPENIRFPVKDHYELLKRAEEILILFGEIEFYSVNRMFKALLKISFRQDIMKNNEAEMMIGYNFLDQFLGTGSSSSNEYLYSMVDFTDEDITPEDGYSNLLSKMRIFSNTLTFTKSPVGSFIWEKQ